MKNTTDKSYEVKKLSGSIVEITGEIAWETLANYEIRALNRLKATLALDGFRKGNVPDEIARKHIPDQILLGDMAELAMAEYYPNILKEASIDSIGRPEVSITKLARRNPMGFTIKSAVVPDISLPDYTSIAKKVAVDLPDDVTDTHINKVMRDLQQMRAYGHVHGDIDGHDHTEALPELNDEFAQSFGNFKTMEALREKVRENLLYEREREVKDKHRVKILDSIISETTFEIPDILLQSEQEKMLAQLEADIQRAGTTLEEHLTQIKKTRDELLADFKPESEKRARFQLVLNAIAKDLAIAVSEDEVTAEAQKIMAMYPGADLERTKAYADMILTNEKVLSRLEQ